MPGMEGIELIRHLQHQSPQVPIVAVSADIQEETRREISEAGASACVAKTELENFLMVFGKSAPGEETLILSSLQRDAFQEMMNIAIRNAAHTLDIFLSQRVRFSVPEMEIMSLDRLHAFFREELGRVGVMVRQPFTGYLEGMAAMVFSLPHAAYLARTLAGIRGSLGGISSEEQSVLTEMGKITLKAAIAFLAYQSGTRRRVGLPELFLDRDEKEVCKLLMPARDDATAIHNGELFGNCAGGADLLYYCHAPAPARAGTPGPFRLVRAGAAEKRR